MPVEQVRADGAARCTDRDLWGRPPGMGDVLSGGPDRPPWRPPRRLISAASVTALFAALVAGLVTMGGSDEQAPATPLGSSSASAPGSAFPDGPDTTVRAGQTPGTVITGLPLPRGGPR